MALEGIEAAQYILGAVPNVPFVDEITGEPQGFTAPLTHFGSVISVWVSVSLKSVIREEESSHADIFGLPFPNATHESLSRHYE